MIRGHDPAAICYPIVIPTAIRKSRRWSHSSVVGEPQRLSPTGSQRVSIGSAAPSRIPAKTGCDATRKSLAASDINLHIGYIGMFLDQESTETFEESDGQSPSIGSRIGVETPARKNSAIGEPLGWPDPE